jgi:hypothetical protein
MCICSYVKLDEKASRMAAKTTFKDKPWYNAQTNISTQMR